MPVFDKDQNVAALLVDDGAAAVETRIGDGDFRPPGRAAVLAATNANRPAAPGGQDRAVQGDHHVGKPLAGEDPPNLESGLAQEGRRVTLDGRGLDRRRRIRQR